jgi:hypothetical protein
MVDNQKAWKEKIERIEAEKTAQLLEQEKRIQELQVNVLSFVFILSKQTKSHF